MTPRELQDLILNGPKAALCAPYVHTNEMPRISGEEVVVKDRAIAAILSEGRVTVVSRLVGEGTISNAMGQPDGPIFLRALRLADAAELPEDAPYAQLAQKATIEHVWRLLGKESLDVGLDAVRDGMLALIGVLPITEAHVVAIRKLAEVPAPISADAVSTAMRGPWGDV